MATTPKRKGTDPIFTRQSAEDLDGLEVFTGVAKNGKTVTLTTGSLLAWIQASGGGVIPDPDTGYTDRGDYSDETQYAVNDRVFYTLSDGRDGYFVLFAPAPAGTPPDDATYWTIDGALNPSPYALSVVLQDEIVNVAQGASYTGNMLVEYLGGLPPDHALDELVSGDKVGLSITFGDPEILSDTDENGEPILDGGDYVVNIPYTVTPDADATLKTYSLTFEVRSSEWLNQPGTPLYNVRSTDVLQVVVESSAAGVDPLPVAAYHMPGSDGAGIAQLLDDDSGNNLTLIREGDVRVTAAADGLLSEGKATDKLYTPVLTGVTMDGSFGALLVMPDGGYLVDGAVVFAFASATVADSYVTVRKSGSNWIARTVMGSTVADSPGVPIGEGRLSVGVDDNTGLLTLHNPSSGQPQVVSLPAWATSNVRASFFGVVKPDNSIDQRSAGIVCVAEFYDEVLSSSYIFRQLNDLFSEHTARAAPPVQPEYSKGTVRAYEINPGAGAKDQTLLAADLDVRDGVTQDAATGDYIIPGITTTGGVHTGFMTDVTLAEDWELTLILPTLFSDSGDTVAGISFDSNIVHYLRLKNASFTAASGDKIIQFQVNAFGTTNFPTLPQNVRMTSPKAGASPTFSYKAATRQLRIYDEQTGIELSGGALTIPADWGSAKVNMSAGGVLRADGNNFQGTATRLAGMHVAKRTLTETERRVNANNLNRIYTAPVDPDPDPDPTPDPSAPFLAVQNFDASVLSPAMRAARTDAFNNWWGKPDGQRPAHTQILVHPAWKDKYKLSPYVVTRTYNGESYKFYNGPAAGNPARISADLHLQGLAALRATKDLAFLDLLCTEVDDLESNASDESSPNNNNPDGYRSFAQGAIGGALWYGAGSQYNTAVIRKGKITYVNQFDGIGDPGPLTGIEITLDSGLLLGAGVAALGAYENRNLYSPQYEPAGSRPASPQYYRGIYLKVMALMDEIRASWRAYHALPKTDLTSKLARQGTWEVIHGVQHAGITQMAWYAVSAKLKGGTNWKSHADYIRARNCWNLTFGPNEKLGARYYLNASGQEIKNMSNWAEVVHPKYGACIFWKHLNPRRKVRNAQDANGFYLPQTTQGVGLHKHNYTFHIYGSVWLLKEMGCDFVPDGFLEKMANGLMAGLSLTEKTYTPSQGSGSTTVPYNMNGNGHIAAIKNPWNPTEGTGNTGANNSLLQEKAATLMAAYEATGDLSALMRRRREEFAKGNSYGQMSGAIWETFVKGL